MIENQHETSITEEDIAFLLEHGELTPEIQDLITKYQRTILEDSVKQKSITTPKYEIGTKCAIVIPYDKYQLVLIPALVLSYTSPDQVQVLILTPVSMYMIPCPAYLKNDPCSSCSYSHGHTISINQILPFETLEMDLISQNLNYETIVWCKKSDDLIWKLGYITDQYSDSRWRVRLKNTSIDLTVDTEDLVLFKCLDDDQVGSKSESESEIEATCVKHNNWGGWERHTTGFASKMMKKMGYIDGQGLGTDAKGRSDPININSINQKGKSGLGYTKPTRSKKTNKKLLSFEYGHTLEGSRLTTDETTFKLQSELDDTNISVQLNRLHLNS